MTLNIMTLSIMMLSIMMLSIMTFSIMTLSITVCYFPALHYLVSDDQYQNHIRKYMSKF